MVPLLALTLFAAAVPLPILDNVPDRPAIGSEV